jgi:hypothetical protein
MQWVALMLVGFLIAGLLRSAGRLNNVFVVVFAGAVLILWFAQISGR